MLFKADFNSSRTPSLVDSKLELFRNVLLFHRNGDLINLSYIGSLVIESKLPSKRRSHEISRGCTKSAIFVETDFHTQKLLRRSRKSIISALLTFSSRQWRRHIISILEKLTSLQHQEGRGCIYRT